MSETGNVEFRPGDIVTHDVDVFVVKTQGTSMRFMEIWCQTLGISVNSGRSTSLSYDLADKDEYE